MSQENLEIVRAAIDAYNRGDVDGAFKDVMPDFEYDQTRAVGIDRGVFNLDEFRDQLGVLHDPCQRADRRRRGSGDAVYERGAGSRWNRRA
jgi:ketosteroid isomerase-like protein